MKGSIKINWRKKIRSIQGSGFNQWFFWVQLGDHTSLGANWGHKALEHQIGAGEGFIKRGKYWTDSVHGVCFSLIITGGAGSRTPSPPEVHYLPPSFLSPTVGPTGQSPPLSSPMRVLLFCYSIFFNSIQSKMGYNSNGDESLQSLYRWKALNE
jgi:hypothetical protein